PASRRGTRMSLRARGERGSVSAFVAVIALGLLMVAGLVYDGGQVLAAQATARDLAANAARAGAQEIDLDALRADGVPLLDPDRAVTAARDYLTAAGAEGDVVVEGTTITVTATIRQEMRILPVPDRVVHATDTARAVPGVTEGDPIDG
ncbi:MAG: pilus assembly protein TadG-related protein, partial [Dehalococcoidia bacterium]